VSERRLRSPKMGGTRETSWVEEAQGKSAGKSVGKISSSAVGKKLWRKEV